MRLDESKVDIQQKDIDKALKRPSDFGMWDEQGKFFVTWALGPVIDHRDSGVLDRSNAVSLVKYLEAFPFDDASDWEITKCNHWAVGWVTHLSYRVVNANGEPTQVARIIKGWFDYLHDVYPIADEDLYSEMETEEANRVWTDCYSDSERLEYIREHRNQFEFHNFSDLLGCVRGKYFAGYASELIDG